MIDYTNILRLDSCFRFLSLAERIELHQSRMSGRYFQQLPKSHQDKIRKMNEALNLIGWEVPEFHTLKETGYLERYWVYKKERNEISETQYAELHRNEFEKFLTILKSL